MLARLVITTVAASAVCGFAVGSVHSRLFAIRNLVKFPLLIMLTSAICAAAYYVSSVFIAPRLTFAEAEILSLRTFRDVSVLLASLAPVLYFLALTIDQPDRSGLGEYPLFLGLNVLLIAAAGSVALVCRAIVLARAKGLSAARSGLVVGTWLAISLFVGGQCAWYLRPFYGVSTVPAPFILGRAPDYRGATSIYEAVWNVVTSPPLDTDYYKDKYRLRGSES